MVITWFILKPSSIILYALLGWFVYLIMHDPNLSDKVKYKTLPGLAVALGSFFDVGLYCFVTVGFYFVGVWVIDLWRKKLLVKKL